MISSHSVTFPRFENLLPSTVSTFFELAKSFKPGWWRLLEETHVTGTKPDLMHCLYVITFSNSKNRRQPKARNIRTDLHRNQRLAVGRCSSFGTASGNRDLDRHHIKQHPTGPDTILVRLCAHGLCEPCACNYTATIQN